MNVLIADSFPESHQHSILDLGCKVAYHPKADPETLPSLIKDEAAEILVVRSTKVTADVFANAPDLQLVIRAGAGVNTIDLDAASAHAVRVANCPGTNAAAVAELTIGLLVSLDRRIPDNVADLRGGRWNKKEYAHAAGLAGRTLGVVGTGAIGRAVISRAQAMEMQIVAWSRSLTDTRARELGIARADNVVDLARTSDAVSVHVAATPETKGLLSAAFFSALPEGALFINTARASVVDESAMRQAIAERGIRAAVDVFDGEPTVGEGEVDATLFSAAGLYGTHHIGASTTQAQEAVAAATVARIAAFVEGDAVPSLVNVPDEDSRTDTRESHSGTIEIRHRNRVGVLAHALTALERDGINVRSMQNRLFAGDEGAIATIQTEPSVGPETIAAVQGSHVDIIAVRSIKARNSRA